MPFCLTSCWLILIVRLGPGQANKQPNAATSSTWDADTSDTTKFKYQNHNHNLSWGSVELSFMLEEAALENSVSTMAITFIADCNNMSAKVIALFVPGTMAVVTSPETILSGSKEAGPPVFWRLGAGTFPLEGLLLFSLSVTMAALAKLATMRAATSGRTYRRSTRLDLVIPPPMEPESVQVRQLGSQAASDHNRLRDTRLIVHSLWK